MGSHSSRLCCPRRTCLRPAKPAQRWEGHLDGCRIGFDLGANDYKVAAVNDGAVVYSNEFPWNPKDQPDPQYHYNHIDSALKKAAAKLPRVDAIGGSAARVVVDNKIMVASLFRAVPAASQLKKADYYRWVCDNKPDWQKLPSRRAIMDFRLLATREATNRSYRR